jgi:hypothetical protein
LQRRFAEPSRADDLDWIERGFAEEDHEDEDDDHGHDEAGGLTGQDGGGQGRALRTG